eukprot:TRINITY_DN18418_c0_g1_i1.p1 TRINITY_DN18418_c0_g1~~TRINITY_DN18418_c0_g1_i1.p1  ORF type:complete len:132 (-),score=28.34 TRINITY_DN18418_c0_g1_i1:13-408(-)
MITQTGQFICIENGFSDIKDPSKLTKYLTTIEQMLNKLITSPDTELPQFQYVTQKIFGYTEYSFGVIPLQKQFLEVVKRTSHLGDELMQHIEAWKDILKAFTVPLPGLDDINVSFIKQIWDLFVKYGKTIL